MEYSFQFGSTLAAWPAFLQAGWRTVHLSTLAMGIGLAAAIVGGILLTFGPRMVRWLITAYVEFIRNTPLLVQLYFVFFALPQLGLRLSSYQAALIALSAHFAAYVIDIVRSGLEAVPKGQVEAAMALGLRRGAIIRHVVLLPAMRASYIATGNQFVLLIIGSSLASAIGVDELMATANNVATQTFRNFEVYIVVGAVFFVIILAARLLVQRSYLLLFRWP